MVNLHFIDNKDRKLNVQTAYGASPPSIQTFIS